MYKIKPSKYSDSVTVTVTFFQLQPIGIHACLTFELPSCFIVDIWQFITFLAHKPDLRKLRRPKSAGDGSRQPLMFAAGYCLGISNPLKFAAGDPTITTRRPGGTPSLNSCIEGVCVLWIVFVMMSQIKHMVSFWHNFKSLWMKESWSNQTFIFQKDWHTYCMPCGSQIVVCNNRPSKHCPSRVVEVTHQL